MPFSTSEHAVHAAPTLTEAWCRVEAQLQTLAQASFDVSFVCRIKENRQALWQVMEHALQELASDMYDVHPSADGLLGLVHPEDHALLNDHLTRVAEGQHDVCVFRLSAPEGRAHWVSSLLRPVVNPHSGQPVQVFGLIQDLSDQSFDLA